jgi:ABC-type transport system involved in resistance to organic solvents, ATPase component
MEKAIEVIGLVTHYGDREILKNISFSIPKGKTTVILGGSGCGKAPCSNISSDSLNLRAVIFSLMTKTLQ